MVWVWVRRSLRYYGTRHLVFAGTVALTSAILCAALLTGESLQKSLLRDLHARLGAVRSAVFLSEGVFPASLAQRLPDTQAALLLKGELLTGEGALCADKAQIIGVADDDAPGGSRGRSPSSFGSGDGGRVSSRAATHLASDPQAGWSAVLNGRGREALPGDDGAVRFERPSLFSVEMPLGAAKEARMVRRAVQVGTTKEAGMLTPDFALRSASVLPVNVQLPYASLSEQAGVPGMANVLVSSRPQAEFERALAETLTPEDMGLILMAGDRRPEVERRASNVEFSETLLKSRRVFLPQGVTEALEKSGLTFERATFHLADAFEAGTNATPYGFVAAVPPDGACVPRDLKDDEIVINAWLAEALGVRTNETLMLRWRRFEAGGRLVADGRAFRVRTVIPMEAAAKAKGAMPVFPGLAGVDSCAAWDVGMPMDAEKLKDAANEAYWKQWRETPKAFLTYAEGKACFGTFFGEAMSVRVAAYEAAVRHALKALTPAQAGFVVRPVWEEGLKAAQGSTDFHMLFAGMAFVLMAAALLLSALSLSLSLETRKSEVALFSALGWGRGRVVWTLAAEWSVPLAAGALAGGGFGAGLARALVWSLGRFWRDAFAGAGMSFHFSLPMACVAACASAALTLAVLLWTVSRFARCRPVELWQGEGRDSSEVQKFGSSKGGEVWANVAGGALAVAALAVMVLSPSDATADGAFFGAGFLLMLSMLLLVKTTGAAWLRNGNANSRYSTRNVQGPTSAGVMRAFQSPRRSAPVVLLLAVGTFLTIGILSMKHDSAAGCASPSSGSGGFASIVTSVTPMDRERGLALARRVSGEGQGRAAHTAVGVVPVRVHEGDEAGCLNMSQPVSPQIIGLDARAMARARAFEPVDSGGVWTLLERKLADGAIPALAADQTMLQYSLKAQAGPADGTVYEYPVAGLAKVRVRVVGSLPVRSGILQGSLIVDEKLFVEMFPKDAGYRLWLCDAAPRPLREAAERGAGSRGRSPSMGCEAVVKARHPEPGVTVETVEERLRLLGSVEGTYLDMFLVLGGLGMVLGVVGIALVILRGVQERRGELALLSAVGLPRQTVMRLFVAEYGVLVLAGLVIGLLPALVAIQPAARSLHSELPWHAMAGVVAGLFGCAAVCVVTAARAASRRYGPEVLKEEV